MIVLGLSESEERIGMNCECTYIGVNTILICMPEHDVNNED